MEEKLVTAPDTSKAGCSVIQSLILWMDPPLCR
jgi:hypothetical protein